MSFFNNVHPSDKVLITVILIISISIGIVYIAKEAIHNDSLADCYEAAKVNLKIECKQ